ASGAASCGTSRSLRQARPIVPHGAGGSRPPHRSDRIESKSRRMKRSSRSPQGRLIGPGQTGRERSVRRGWRAIRRPWRASEREGASMIPPRPLDSHGRTDRGRVRESNEDHFLVAHLTKEMTIDGTSLDLEGGASLASDRVGGLFLVADGVAGRAAGEQASALAIETVRNHVLHTMPWFLRLGAEDDRERLVEALQRALAASNRVVRSAGRDAR